MSKTIKRITDLIPDDRNANKGTARGHGMLRDSLQRSGFGRPVLADRNGKIIAGNKTIEEAVAAGFDVEDLIVVRSNGTQVVIHIREDLDLDDDPDSTARYIATADNRVAEVGLDWNAAEIAALLEEHPTIVQSMFNEDELAAVMDGIAPEIEPADDPGAQVDRAEELREQWQVEHGQLWEIPSLSVPGKSHRLLCGDSTSAEDVARLMGGAEADMVFADPPYGMRLEVASFDQRNRSTPKFKAPVAKNWDVVEGDFEDYDPRAVMEMFAAAREQFWWGADYYAERIPNKNDGAWFVWDKRGDSTDSMIGSSFELCWSKQKHRREVIRILWVGILGTESEDVRQRVHPTQKPYRLPLWFIEKFSKHEDVVVDPYLGSGPTMVAAEQTGRVCYGMEIEPKYIAVALERMSGMGLEPLLVGQV